MSDYDAEYEKQIKELERHNKNIQKLVEVRHVEDETWRNNFLASLEALKNAQKATPMVMSASDGMSIKHVTNRLRHMGLKDKICTLLSNIGSSMYCDASPRHQATCDAISSTKNVLGCDV